MAAPEREGEGKLAKENRAAPKVLNSHKWCPSPGTVSSSDDSRRGQAKLELRKVSLGGGSPQAALSPVRARSQLGGPAWAQRGEEGAKGRQRSWRGCVSGAGTDVVGGHTESPSPELLPKLP